MKKHLFTLAIIAFTFFLSSCSIMKRHYVSGYYISHNSTSATNKAQEQIIEKKITPPLYTIQNIANKGNTDYNLKSISLPENEFISANNKQVISKNAPFATHKKHLGYNAPKIVRAEENTKLLCVKKPSPDDLVVDALSLFWIIILILLILWLVAILTGGWGLGWTIHILLVVALILLILWLLRII